MKRLAAVVAIALAGFVAAVVVLSSPDRNGCPLKGAADSSYSGRFVGHVSTKDARQLVRVTRNGRPLSGAGVCVNTEMVGMSGMAYTAKGTEVAPGRYRLSLRFEMAGRYRAKVLTDEGGRQVAIPLLVKVSSTSAAPR